MEKEGWEGRRCRRSHHVREEGIRAGALHDEELGDVDDVLLVQAQLLLQEVAVPVDAALQREGTWNCHPRPSRPPKIPCTDPCVPRCILPRSSPALLHLVPSHPSEQPPEPIPNPSNLFPSVLTPLQWGRHPPSGPMGWGEPAPKGAWLLHGCSSHPPAFRLHGATHAAVSCSSPGSLKMPPAPRNHPAAMRKRGERIHP